MMAGQPGFVYNNDRGTGVSNKPHMRVTDKRSGLVEIFTEGGKVVLQLFPPGREPVNLPMTPDAAASLADGLLDGAREASGGGQES